MNREDDDRREGSADRREEWHGRRSTDSPVDRRFAFDILKWAVAIAVALIGIYVLSEKRAAVSDISAAYLDKKVDEIKDMNEKQASAISARLDSLQQSVQSVAAANSGMQAQLKAQDDKIDEIKSDYKRDDEMLRAEIVGLRNQLADVKAKVR